jgi:peptidoglycan/LPS O-acetylase OafA/YrhL
MAPLRSASAALAMANPPASLGSATPEEKNMVPRAHGVAGTAREQENHTTPNENYIIAIFITMCHHVLTNENVTVQRAMNKSYSLYLDIVRLTAAVLVVLAHYCQHGIVSAALRPFVPELGREAVVIFFVLSGFVIAYSTARKAVSLRQYAVARCARIYSVAAPILLLAFLLAMLVQPDFQIARWYLYLPMHLLFTGELWNLSQTPPLLTPYWSLGFEVWYYVFFGALMYSRGRVRILLAAVILLVMGHKLWLLLPIWMSGAYLFARQKHLPVGTVGARIGCVLTIVALVLFQVSGTSDMLRTLGNSIWPFAGLKLGSADRYLADYVVCVLVYLHFACARQADFRMLERIQGPIRALAAYTFTLYLVHYPVMCAWRAYYRHDNTSAWDIAALSFCICLACYVLGFVTEHRKPWFQARFDALFGAVDSLRGRLRLRFLPAI